MTIGTIGILNVGAGDTTLSFDPKNPTEVARAKRIVTDMLKQGFALLVAVGKKNGEPIYQRAKGFDPKTCEYIIAGAPEDFLKTKKGKTTRVAASQTRAVAIGRTAGG